MDYEFLNGRSSKTKESAAHNLLRIITDSISKAQQAISSAQLSQAEQYNSKHRPSPKYAVGDLVFLSSDGINWPSYSSSPKNRFHLIWVLSLSLMLITIEIMSLYYFLNIFNVVVFIQLFILPSLNLFLIVLFYFQTGRINLNVLVRFWILPIYLKWIAF